MTLRKAVFALALAAPVAAGLALAQEMPKPGPEQAILKQDVGVWDATVESWMAPGQPPAVSKGVDTVSMIGEFWSVDDFKSEFMGQPFHGTGTTGYDPFKKKYVGTWVDSMAPSLNVGEFTYDAKTKTMSGVSEGPGMDGKPMKMRQTTEWKDADNKVYSIYSAGPDGKEMLFMRITYKRRK